jgi:hypothetical protein
MKAMIAGTSRCLRDNAVVASIHCLDCCVYEFDWSPPLRDITVPSVHDAGIPAWLHGTILFQQSVSRYRAGTAWFPLF